MCSAYSFLYSYRDSKESPVPDINSEIAENAFNKLLELKTELSNGMFNNIINKKIILFDYILYNLN